MLKKLMLMSCLSALLCVGSRVMAMSPEYRNQLIENMFNAAVDGDMKALDQAVRQDPTIVNQSMRGNNGICGVVLQTALDRQDCNMISYLLSKGAHWDGEFRPGDHILTTLAIRYSVDIMDCFIKAGMPIDHKFGGSTVLHSASAAGRVDMINYLLKKGASWILQEDSSSLPAPFLAVASGKTGAVETFFQHDPKIVGMQVHDRGKVNYMLHVAIASKDDRMIEYLLKKGSGIALGAQGWNMVLQEAQASGNNRVVSLIEKYRAAEFKKNRLASSRSGGNARRERLQGFLVDRATGAPVKELVSVLLPAQSQDQDQQSQSAGQASEQAKKKKKKKNKNKKVEQKDDGGSAQAGDVQVADPQDGALLEAGSDDGAAWTKWEEWEQDITQAGLGVRYEEQEEQAQKAYEKQLAEAQARRKKKHQESQELVHALQSFVWGNKSTYEWPRKLILRYALVEEHQKEYGQLYDQVYDALFNSTGKQKRVKAAPVSANSQKQPKVKSAGASAQHQNRGAGKKTNKQEKRSHIAPQRVPVQPLPKPAPSMYDRLHYEKYLDGVGAPKQQAGDYVLKPDSREAQDGGEAYNSHASHDMHGDSVHIVPGDAGENMLFYEEGHERPASTWPHAQPDSGQVYDDGGDIQDGQDKQLEQRADHSQWVGYKKLRYGNDELWANMRHIIDGDTHGGGHFDNANKSCFHHWIKKDFENRVERAIQNLAYRGPDAQGRDCIAGVLDPEQAGEVPVPFKGRITTIRGYVVHDPKTGEETLIEDVNGQPISILGTLFPIERREYARLVNGAQVVEEKDDRGPAFANEYRRVQPTQDSGALSAGAEDYDAQELDLNSWDADVQAGEGEQDESIWGD